jgi:membrane associated rhomboid family serine protease
VSPTWRTRQDWQQLKITRGALVVLIAELVVSGLWVFAAAPFRAQLQDYIIATPANVLDHGRVWTLVTAPLLELDFVALVLSVLVMWMFVPTLEKFWGRNRFIRFVAVTSIAGSLGGVLAGWALGHPDAQISGLSPFVYASIVAFGILYASQPVQFSFYIKLTGRQLMLGFLGFVVLFVVIQGVWEKGASFAAAMLAAALMTSKRWSPGLMWRRWRIARARARLSVLEGGVKSKPKKSDERYMN